LSKFEIQLKLKSELHTSFVAFMFSSKKNRLGLFISPPLSDSGVEIKNLNLDPSSCESISSKIGFVSYGKRPPLSDIESDPALCKKNFRFFPPLLKALSL
jgi:hypothetical protein